MSLYNIILFVIYKILYDDIFRAKKKKERKENIYQQKNVHLCTFHMENEYYRKNVL